MKKSVKLLLASLTVIVLLLTLAVTSFAATPKMQTYTDEDGNIFEFYMETTSVSHPIVTKITVGEKGIVRGLCRRLGGFYADERTYKNAFKGNKDIKSLEIPRDWQEIPDRMFAGCTNLEEITFEYRSSEMRYHIGEYAFANTGLKSIFIPKEISSIFAYAFANCEQLESIVFEERNDTSNAFQKSKEPLLIREYAFTNTGVKQLYLPTEIRLENSVFENCKKLQTLEVYMSPDATKSAAYNSNAARAFANCTSLKTVRLAHGYESMFEGCTALETVATNWSVELEARTFKDCVSLRTANLPLVDKLGEGAFENCASLLAVDFPEAYYVDDAVFKNCTSLVTANLPAMRSVDASFFENCTSLVEATFMGGAHSFIGENAFRNCTSLKKVNCDYVLSIYTAAFQNCTALEEFDLVENQVKRVAMYAFDGCISLKNVDLSGNTFLGYRAFADCTALEKIIIPDNYTHFTVSGNAANEAGVFLGCTGVKYIYLGAGVTTDDFSAIGFDGYMPRLEKIEVSPNNPRYRVIDGILYYYGPYGSGGDKLFLVRCPALWQGEAYSTADAVRQIIGENDGRYMRIASYAFSDTKYLKSVELTLPISCILDAYPEQTHRFARSSVEKISFDVDITKYPFYDDDEYAYLVKYLNAFHKIDEYDFYESQIRNIDLSKTKFIGQYAFYGCKNLKEIHPDECEAIRPFAFAGCDGLVHVDFKNPYLEALGDGVFSNCDNLKIANFSGAQTRLKFGVGVFANNPKLTIFCDEKSVSIIEYARGNNIPVNAMRVDFFDNADLQYTGNEVRPGVLVSIGGMTLVQNRDYILHYSDNIKLGTATVTVEFIGDFEGLESTERFFTIRHRNIGTVTVEYAEDYIFSGDEVKPSVVVKFGDKTLIEGTDYGITYKNGSDTGTMLFTVYGLGNFTGIADYYYNIIRRDISEATADSIPDSVYTGTEICPEPTLKWNGFVLINGEDYEIRYFENINAGFATMVIYGKGNFCGTVKLQYRIFGMSVGSATASAVPDMEYTGSEITPEITVTLDGKTLVQGTDYTVEYRNNLENGTAEIVINGIGNYSGTRMQTFKIYKNSVYSFTVFSETEMTATYDGTPLTPEMEVYFGTKLLREGTDYTVRLENNVNAGTATVTICGIGKFEGERSFDFTILPCEVSANDIAVSGNMEFGGAAVTPQITVTKNGETLQNGTDYTVNYANNTAVGTARMTVTGIGNYMGNVEIEYEIYAPQKPEETDPPKENGGEEGTGGNENAEQPTKQENPETDFETVPESDKNVSVPKTGEEFAENAPAVWAYFLFASALGTLFITIKQRKRRIQK